MVGSLACAPPPAASPTARHRGLAVAPLIATPRRRRDFASGLAGIRPRCCPGTSKSLSRYQALTHGVEYLVVGGYAMALHGRPRHTGDRDIWLRRNPENARRLMVMLREFGFGGLGPAQQDFALHENMVQPGYRLSLDGHLRTVTMHKFPTSERRLKAGQRSSLYLHAARLTKAWLPPRQPLSAPAHRRRYSVRNPDKDDAI